PHDRVRVLLPERVGAARRRELPVALADVVAVAVLLPAARGLLLRALHAVEAEVVERLALRVAVIALCAARVVLRLVVVADRVVVLARHVPRLVLAGLAVGADVLPRLVAR